MLHGRRSAVDVLRCRLAEEGGRRGRTVGQFRCSAGSARVLLPEAGEGRTAAAGVRHRRWKTGDDGDRSCYVLAGCSTLPPAICFVDVVVVRRRRRITVTHSLRRCFSEPIAADHGESESPLLLPVRAHYCRRLLSSVLAADMTMAQRGQLEMLLLLSSPWSYGREVDGGAGVDGGAEVDGGREVDGGDEVEDRGDPRGEIANAELEVKLPRREIEVNSEVEVKPPRGEIAKLNSEVEVKPLKVKQQRG
nr:hypothetical protein Iba_chr01dCG2210 [Ipomoea batatas]